MIYWDNNATTPLAPEVLEAMLPYLQERFYNPSASYGVAKEVKRSIEESRAQVAALLGAEPDEIVFTSGGTEATNASLAQFSRTLALATDHPATLRTAHGEVCPVLGNGVADLLAWKELLPAHDGVSFAWANHETGVIQPVRSLCQAAREAGCRVHADLVQAAAKIPIRLHEYEIDFASVSAHKFHGPKGVGALYVRRGVSWKPLLTGGRQEDAHRAGTENVAGMIGMGKAAELAMAAARRYASLARLRTRFEQALQASGIVYEVNGGTAPRLPHVLNIRIPGCTAQSLFLLLEPWGLLCSAGSACTSADPEPSHVLRAMGIPDPHIRESLRLSLSRYTTEEEVDEAAALVIKAVRKVQAVQSAHTGPVMVYR